jgi:16S rRNA (guanine(966)-N(2))-methyltransferase RsmD
MRVIAGTAGGRTLAAIKGRGIRPTTDRVREALFSILQSKLGGFNGKRVLDLFAGSGALAIEALSRGARGACLIEQDAAAIGVINENLERCQMGERSRLYRGSAWQVITALEPPFDLIFVDPPYGQGLAERALGEIDSHALLAGDGLVCVETGADETLAQTVGELSCIDRRRYGTIVLLFFERTKGARLS